jgi:UDP-N-acetylmuramate: L-alanyl-gamma-D-glutamyl-meso-diaminopimelate ligase
VVEGDEYDTAFFDKRPKFVHYMPDVAIIGNVEYDHADIYPDLAAVQRAFVHLMNLVPRRGLLVAGLETPALREILPRAPCPVETFGLGEGADWRAVDVRPAADGWHFRLLRRGADQGEFRLSLPGEHNLRNALAAVAVAAAAGVDPDAARPALASFGGVKRRLEIRGRKRGVTVYDDFAHHPTAVRETLRALRSLLAPGAGRLLAVFEPRSYTSRTRVFQEEFARAFQEADQVIVSAAHLPGKVPERERISETELVRAISELGKDARFIPRVDEIVAALSRDLREGDRVVVLSNGGFGGIHEKLLRALDEAGARPGR